ncbi:hypothetical protein HY636_00300 [Candidatus Woesearchaeota archaeon]|nr:hypothetical protein [Candidatus Woesearchaeota archaeon]
MVNPASGELTGRIDRSGELTDRLVINTEHTTAHERYYSGDFKPFLRHSEEKRYSGFIELPYDYIDVNALREFLVSEKLISQEEFPLDKEINGSKFWLFSPDVAIHKQRLEKRVSGCNGFFIYNPNDPLINVQVVQDECGLVTSAYVVKANKLDGNDGKMYGSWSYNPTRPEEFTDLSFLQVKTRVQIKPNALVRHIKEAIANRIEHKYVNLVLTDLRRRLNAGTDYTSAPDNIHDMDDINNELTQMYASVGGDTYCDVGFVTLRTANHDTYRFAQANMLPALNTVLSDPSVIEMLLIQREIGILIEISCNYGQNQHDKFGVRADILEAHKSAEEKLMKQLYPKYLDSAVERLGQHEEVVSVLRLM